MLPPSDSEEEYEDEETEYVEKEISAEEKRRMKKVSGASLCHAHFCLIVL